MRITHLIAMCLALLLGLATKEGLIQAEAALSAEPACHHAARLLRPGLLDSDEIGQPGKTRGGCRDIYVSYTDGQVKIYRPDLFRVLRNGAGVSDEAFLESIDVAQLHSLASDSKSGQAFWRSGDGKVVLKTIKHYECVNLRNIIDSYAIHVLEDHSCIAGVIGVFRVKLPHGKKVYMLACKNVYHDGMSFEDGGSWKNRVKYDLKGSQVGRVRAPASDVLKDLDLMRSRQLLHLGDASKTALLHALHRDVVFLSTHHFMDYSLLVEVEEYAPGLVRGMAARIQGFRLPTSIDDRGKLVILGSDNKVYHFGIIDFLQKYSFRKMLETLFKGIFHDARKLSCVAPRFYARRMFSFIDQHTD